MIDRITIGAACLMASLSGLTVIARMWPARELRAVPEECLLEDPLPPWTDETPSRGVFAQTFKWCTDCCRDESVVWNKDGWLCNWCSTPIPADGVGAGLGGAA